MTAAVSITIKKETACLHPDPRPCKTYVFYFSSKTIFSAVLSSRTSLEPLYRTSSIWSPKI
jgi:hypothetical protein